MSSRTCQIWLSACSNGLYLYRPPVSFIIPGYRLPPPNGSSTVTAREYGIFALPSILPLVWGSSHSSQSPELKPESSLLKWHLVSHFLAVLPTE